MWRGEKRGLEDREQVGIPRKSRNARGLAAAEEAQQVEDTAVEPDPEPEVEDTAQDTAEQ